MRTKKLILCVDDEDMNLDLLDATLSPRGYDVLLCESGHKALELLAKHPVDLVLLDVMMPGLDGYNVCRTIKADKRFMLIPVVMITSLKSKDDRIKSIEAGAEDFISKPFDQTEVLARIKMLLKVRELNVNLARAYDDINKLTTFGKMAVKSFESGQFNLGFAIDKIIKQVMPGPGSGDGHPGMCVVGIPLEQDGWEWTRFENEPAGIKSIPLDMDLQIHLHLPPDNKARIVSYDAENLNNNSKMKNLVNQLRMSSILVDNLLCYLSSSLCIFTMNYSREITRHDADVLNTLVMHTLFVKSTLENIHEIEGGFTYSLHALARASEANDEDTGNHILRVGTYASILATELKQSEAFCRDIKVHALTHDVGKLHVPLNILIKPEPLNKAEFSFMKKHTQYGAMILGGHPRLRMAKTIALTHHENWDGTGYPNALVGDAIPLAGHITKLADQYDALRNARVYKAAFDHATTVQILTKGDGRTQPKHFSPTLLAAFASIASRFDDTFNSLSDDFYDKVQVVA
ncbi:response regulator [Desulfovibrio caledoniensis]